VISDLFTDAVTIQQLASSRDAGGGVLSSWTGVALNVQCRIEDASADAKEDFARLQMAVSHCVYQTWGTMEVGFRLIDAASGRIFVVKGSQHFRAIGNMLEYWATFAEEQRGQLG
jgi:hypothetical protein